MVAPLLRRTGSLRGETPLLHVCGSSHRKVSVLGALCVLPDGIEVRFYFGLTLSPTWPWAFPAPAG